MEVSRYVFFMNQQTEIERIVWFYGHGNIPKRAHTHTQAYDSSDHVTAPLTSGGPVSSPLVPQRAVS